jgi:hypothetical protein
MQASPLLGPVVALVAWSILMLFWTAIVRAQVLRGREIPNGARGADLEGRAPGKVLWPSHNYTHLMEQPTLFYAIVFALVLMDFDAPINVWLAWGYVAFRIVHSLLQATVNIVRIRLLLFAAATLCLIGLTTHAALRLIG